MKYVIFTGGDLSFSQLAKKAIADADVIIAADSGANTAVSLHIYPTVVIGDFDSISKKTKKILEKKNSIFVSYPQEKNETDTELTITYALSHNATQITILGGIAGDRFDHVITTLFLAAECKIPLRFINENQISWVVKGPQEIVVRGKKDDLLSLIPLTSEVTHIRTTNLYYPLDDESLFLGKSRGVSNVLAQNDAVVSFSIGALLFVHTQTQK